MPIKGDRLRWPPRPGKKSSEVAVYSGLRRAPSNDRQSANTGEPLAPHERDETTDQPSNAPRDVIKQAHDDVESGKKDTDCRNQAAKILGDASDR